MRSQWIRQSRVRGNPLTTSRKVASRLPPLWTRCILGSMGTEGLVLTGTHIRLEPLEYRHVEGLAAASATDSSLYQWSPVPQGKVEATSYVDTALAWRDAGSAVSFAIVRLNDGYK